MKARPGHSERRICWALGQGHRLEDLGSANGTSVGPPVLLQAGDRIEFGGDVLLLAIASGAAPGGSAQGGGVLGPTPQESLVGLTGPPAQEPRLAEVPDHGAARLAMAAS